MILLLTFFLAAARGAARFGAFFHLFIYEIFCTVVVAAVLSLGAVFISIVITSDRHATA